MKKYNFLKGLMMLMLAFFATTSALQAPFLSL